MGIYMAAERRSSKAMENNKISDESFLGVDVKEDKTTMSNGYDHDHEEGTSAEINKALTADPSAKETNADQYSSPNSTLKNQEDQLKSAKAEMGEVREENERLKMLLARVVKDYKSLQMHFFDILRQEEEAKKPKDTTAEHHDNNTNQENEEPELVCLSLGKTSTNDKSKKDEKKTSNVVVIGDGRKDHDEELNGGLELGLGCRTSEILKNNISSSDNSFEEPNKEEEQTDQIWSSPSKIQKTTKSSGDDEVSQHITHTKKTRVSVRARCDAPTMNDGCQWRKYGQKIAKGNPCPRAYYRCTVSPSCPVRKQVQRCAEDMTILITTYEGNHDHPLPISATPMASTTSAAVSMLQSRSSSSQPGSFMNTATAPMSTSTPPNNNLHGLNFSSFHNPRLPQSFYFPNTSISTSSSHPTITLDLTSGPSNSSHFGRSYNSSSTSLNFSSSSTSSWNNYNGYNSVSNGTTPYQNRNYQTSGFLNTNGKRPFQEPYNYMNSNNINYQNINASKQQSLTETIAAATKAIASNPKFQTALAAALTSVVGNGGSGARENQGGGCTESLTLKNGIGCGPSSYLNRSSSMNSQQLQQGTNLGLLPPTLLSLSASKSSTLSPTENTDH